MSEPDDKPKIHQLVMIDAVDVLGVAIGDHAAALKSRDGVTVGFSETARDGVSAGFDTNADGTLDTRVSGKPPQNEADSLVAARLFVAALNGGGSKWATPTTAVEPADFETFSIHDPIACIRGQVTRAYRGTEIWHSLARSGSVRAEFTPDALVAQLRESIASKSDRKYAYKDRLEMYLLLDANRVPAFVSNDVRERAIVSLQADCNASGYLEIWVIGPTAEASYRLFRKVA